MNPTPQAEPAHGNLAKLDQTGTPPKDRVASSLQARSIYESLVRSDLGRSKKRALLRGMLDGNPPYRQADLKAAGRDYQCNVNWRIGEAYLGKAVGAFYDIFAEASSYATVTLKPKKGVQADQSRWSDIVTENFDWLLKHEHTFDYNIQVSQSDMVFFGRGPLAFQDPFDWRPISVADGNLKVPERTKSDTEYWELCTIERDYTTDELYNFIKDGPAAVALGWDVECTKEAIMRAHPDYQRGQMYRTWEWHQQELRDGSYYYGMRSNVIKCVHLYYREFAKPGQDEGEVSHKIFIGNTSDQKEDKFIFQGKSKNKNWREVVHPMYYDHGGGGFHHSVIGMGIAMYSAVEYQNRLKCNLADKAFTPKVMFKATSEQAFEDFALQQMGDYSIITPGVDPVQTPISGVMQEGLEFDREITGFLASNLSQYRQDQQESSGNPITATEAQYKASEQARLGKTQLNRYYEQFDHLYMEMYRRAIDPALRSGMPGGSRAEEFRKRCVDAGVPLECLKDVELVCANRVIGQGSEFLRNQTLSSLFTEVLPMLPEGGRDNLICDVIASKAGHRAVSRYYPTPPQYEKPDDQTAFAMNQVGDMKQGIPAVPTDTQNSLIYAKVFLQAGMQAIQSLQKGANPVEIEQFLELLGAATATHIQRLSQDPSRKAVVKVLGEQLAQMAKAADQIKQKNQKDAEDKQAQQQKQLQAQQQAQQMQQDPIVAAKADQVKQQMQLDQQKHDQMLQQDGEKHRQDMALKDAGTAAEIHRKTMISNAEKGPEVPAAPGAA